MAVILAMFLLGFMHKWRRDDLSRIMDDSLAPAAIVVFVTGAGGVFAKVLTKSGIGKLIAGSLIDMGVPVIFLAFLVATVFKVAQGSGTVAALCAAGLVQASVQSGGYTDFQVALILMAIGCGAVALSHINDSGFWIATKFLGLSVSGGLRTWSVLTTTAGWTAMIIASLFWFVA